MEGKGRRECDEHLRKSSSQSYSPERPSAWLWLTDPLLCCMVWKRPITSWVMGLCHCRFCVNGSLGVPAFRVNTGLKKRQTPLAAFLAAFHTWPGRQFNSDTAMLEISYSFCQQLPQREEQWSDLLTRFQWSQIPIQLLPQCCRGVLSK